MTRRRPISRRLGGKVRALGGKVRALGGKVSALGGKMRELGGKVNRRTPGRPNWLTTSKV